MRSARLRSLGRWDDRVGRASQESIEEPFGKPQRDREPEHGGSMLAGSLRLGVRQHVVQVDGAGALDEEQRVDSSPRGEGPDRRRELTAPAPPKCAPSDKQQR